MRISTRTTIARDYVVTLYLQRPCDGIVLMIKMWHVMELRLSLRIRSHVMYDKLKIVLHKHVVILANEFIDIFFFL